MSGEIQSVFRRVTTGVYVIGVAHGARRNAFTAAWLMQVSFDPLLIALSINPANASYPLLRDSAAFSVSVLNRQQLEVARRFGTHSGASDDKLAASPWHRGPADLPILDDALAWLTCEVTQWVPAGDHLLAIGQVTHARLLDGAAQPMCYADTGSMDGSAALYPRSVSGP